jgi:hypothetical protein
MGLLVAGEITTEHGGIMEEREGDMDLYYHTLVVGA